MHPSWGIYRLLPTRLYKYIHLFHQRHSLQSSRCTDNQRMTGHISTWWQSFGCWPPDALVLTSGWSLLNFVHYILCFSIDMEDQMLVSQIAFQTFLCSYQPRPMWNWLLEKRYTPKELRLFSCRFTNASLYIHLG